jgi:uncharacterized membrane protein YphA (DoxX/SURF4 family)
MKNDSASRIMGTFSEPSGAGLALTPFYAGYLYEYYIGKSSALKVVIAATAIGMVRSSSSLVAVVVLTIAILVFHPFYCFPWAIDRQRFKKFIFILGAALLVILSPISTAMKSYTLDKTDTLSYAHRIYSDMYSMQLFVNTHGVGVGLGSNRPSGFIPSLLSCVGLPGAILFALMVIQIMRNARKESAWMCWAVMGVLINMALGGPDLNQSVVWIFLALTAYCAVVPGEKVTGKVQAVLEE